MSSRTANGRQFFRTLTGLDIGLRIRVRRSQSQGAIFAGAENLSVEALTSDLAEMVSGLVVYSYALRGQLEQVTFALQANVQSRSWSYARRAALDLAGVLALAQKQRQVSGSRAVRGADCALRIAEERKSTVGSDYQSCQTACNTSRVSWSESGSAGQRDGSSGVRNPW